MGKVKSFKRPNPNKVMVAPEPQRFLPAFAYFVGYRVVRGDQAIFRSLILTVPGPIRDSEQLFKVERMLLEKAQTEMATPGIAIVGQSGLKVQITSLAFLEYWEQPLTPEQVEMVNERNRRAAEDAKNAGNAGQ